VVEYFCGFCVEKQFARLASFAVFEDEDEDENENDFQPARQAAKKGA